MKQLMLFSIIILSGSFVIAQDTSYAFTPAHRVVLDKEHGKKIVSQCSRKSPRTAKRFFNITELEAKGMEENFKKISIAAEKSWYGECCEFEKFVYQYMGFYQKGKRYIYINTFPLYVANDFGKNWETHPLRVCDGGSSFWGIVYDIEEKNFIEYATNGVADYYID